VAAALVLVPIANGVYTLTPVHRHRRPHHLYVSYSQMKFRVAITTTVITEVECGNAAEGSVDWNIAFNNAISPLSNSIRSAVSVSISGYSNTVYPGSVDYGYLDDKSNIYQCAQCKRLFTDREKIDQIPGILIGRSVGGHPSCSECEMFPRDRP